MAIPSLFFKPNGCRDRWTSQAWTCWTEELQLLSAMAREFITGSADTEMERLSDPGHCHTCTLCPRAWPRHVHGSSTCLAPLRAQPLYVHSPSMCTAPLCARLLYVHGSSACMTPSRARPLQVHDPFRCMTPSRARPLHVQLLGLLSTIHHTSPLQHVFWNLIEWDTLIAAFII